MTKEENTNGQEQKKASRKKVFIENFKSLFIALVLVLIIRSSIIESVKVPSGSMLPTIRIGDYIFVNKFAYGLKIPFSDWVTDSPVYIFKRNTPQRGDIIVFNYPKDESIYYIKRVVAVAGDIVEQHNKRLYINGKPLPTQKLSETETKDLRNIYEFEFGGYIQEGLQFYNEKFENLTHIIAEDDDQYFLKEYGPTTVPEGNVFVMGDNRDHSNDGRFWGFVPLRLVKGKALFIWLSVSIDFSESRYWFRPERIGQGLH